MMSSATLIASPLREVLGDFSSIVCFKAMVTGIEDALGGKAAFIALVSAGRACGKQLAASLELVGQENNLTKVCQLIADALGPNGTRLCLIEKIEKVDDEILVYCRETICSTGEEPGSPRELSYTLGAVQGVLEALTGRRLRGRQVASVLRGSQYDVIAFTTFG